MKSLRTRLFVWYLGSLLILAAYFYIVVHMMQWKYGTETFIGLIIVLSLIGFAQIYRIILAITTLSKRMKTISSENLKDRVTEIKRDDEIGELSSTFNALLDRLDDAFQREQQFIADVAHEMKTPLATLKGSLELSLERKRSEDDYKKVISGSVQEVTRLSDTLKNVLDLAWAGSPVEQKSPRKVNLTELVEELAEIAEKMASQKGLAVEKAIEKGIYVKGFKDKLGHALLNIIDNAINYTSTGSISITLKQVKDKAFVLIKDTGPGIAEKDIPHIFTRFYRGKKTDKVFGSGLGLAIAKSMIELHGGTIEVESEVGKGTMFVVSIQSS